METQESGDTEVGGGRPPEEFVLADNLTIANRENLPRASILKMKFPGEDPTRSGGGTAGKIGRSTDD